jgi:ketosteroid isomerase-like protein
MAHDNVETFRRGVESIQLGDAEAGVAIAHPDVVIEPLRAATEGVFVGHAGVRDFFADTAATFDLFQPQYTDVRDLGDRVLAIGSLRVRGRGSGVETDIPTAAIAEYRDGLLWRYRDYGEAALALEPAGLSE